MCNPTAHPDDDIECGSVASSLKSLPRYPVEDADDDFSDTESTQRHPLIKLPPPSKSRRCHHNDQPTDTTNHDAGIGSSILDSLPATQQMVLLSFLMFLFFGMHNILQEAIVNLIGVNPILGGGEGKNGNLTLMLGYAEVVGVTFFSYMERVHLTDEGGWSRKAPLRAYPLLTACLFASSSLSNLSLSYINFPTKVGK